MRYLYDKIRHVVCLPYSIANLHEMASNLGIGRHWFDPHPYPHYDIPKRMMASISQKAELVRPREILMIAKNGSTSKNEQLIKLLVREEVDRFVRNSAGMIGGADLGRSSGNRPPTMAALGGNNQEIDDDIASRAQELFNDLNVKISNISKRRSASHERIARTQEIIDATLLPLINGDKTISQRAFQATIDSLLDIVDLLEKNV